MKRRNFSQLTWKIFRFLKRFFNVFCLCLYNYFKNIQRKNSLNWKTLKTNPPIKIFNNINLFIINTIVFNIIIYSSIQQILFFDVFFGPRFFFLSPNLKSSCWNKTILSFIIYYVWFLYFVCYALYINCNIH